MLNINQFNEIKNFLPKEVVTPIKDNPSSKRSYKSIHGPSPKFSWSMDWYNFIYYLLSSFVGVASFCGLDVILVARMPITPPARKFNTEIICFRTSTLAGLVGTRIITIPSIKINKQTVHAITKHINSNIVMGCFAILIKFYSRIMFFFKETTRN